MARAVIVYATTEGHTAHIASHMATVLEAKGHRADAVGLADSPQGFALADYDAAILGGSVHLGRHPAALVEFVKTNIGWLETHSAAFFSVSLSAGGARAQDRSDAERYVWQFLEGTGWKPARVGVFAGALLYTEYGPVKRYVMKRIMKSAGGDTDTSRDYDYTDWEAVTRFAEDFASQID
jgi:menaquinone-dependent protoporphyrinogen oxidase